MSAVTRTHPIWRPRGQTIQIDIGGSRLKGWLAVPTARSGPGLVLAHHRGEPDAAVRELCADYAEEGYLVLAPELPARENPAAALAAIEAARQTLAERPERKGRIAVLGHGRGGSLAVSAAARFGFDALAAYDADGATLSADDLGRVSCPLVLQFGTKGDPAAEKTAARARAAVKSHQDARVHAYPDAAPRFGLKDGAAFDKRIAAIAHTRTLDVVRRVLGPHYDYVALFAEHAHHEFVTRDANRTMATMVDEPYVNHVPTLTGGVGHDLLKRFYKYHFVDQNSGERDNTPISYTVGGNRLVIEQVVRFKHDRVIDRMYPGIEPTGKEVEIPLVICVTFRGDKVAHEHLYWDQASALAQIGLIDTAKLPVAGREQAAKLLDETRPSNELMARSWQTSQGKPA
jgi:carboxymethylenebutenolidase